MDPGIYDEWITLIFANKIILGKSFENHWIMVSITVIVTCGVEEKERGEQTELHLFVIWSQVLLHSIVGIVDEPIN